MNYQFNFNLGGNILQRLGQLNQQFAPIMQRAGQLTSRFRSMFSGASQSVDQLRRNLDALKGRRDLMVDTRQIRAANREIQQLEGRMNNLQNAGRRGAGSDGSSGGLMGLARGALPALGIAGLMAGAGHLATMGMEREQTKVAFEQFVGKDGVEPMMKQLNHFADVTPYSNEDIYNSGRTLLSAKVDPGKLNEVMTQLGNMAAVSQKDFGEMSGAYAKIKQKGFVDSGELHQEFGGTAIMDQLKKDKGVNGEALFKMAEKKEIRFEDLQTAIAHLSEKGGLYEGGLEKLSQTAGGKWSTFTGTLENKITELAEKLNPMLGSLFDFGSALLAKIDPIIAFLTSNLGKLWDATAPLRELFADLFGVIGNLFDRFGGMAGAGSALSAVFDVLAAVVWVISSALKIVGELVLWLADSAFVQLVAILAIGVKGWWLLNAAMAANPVGIVIAGLIAVAAGIKYAWDHVDTFRYKLITLWEVAKAVFAGIAKAKDAALKFDLAGVKAAFSESWATGMKNAEIAIAADKKARSTTAPATPKTPAQTGAGMPKEAAGGAGGAGGDKKSGDKAKAKKDLDATTGGTKSTNITINIAKLVEKLDIHAATVGAGLQDVESMVSDALIRVLYSAKAVGD